jgi:general stress protein YciG
MEVEKKGMSRQEAGSLGGVAVFQRFGSKHMAEIGRKGGAKVSKNKDHMAKIGKKGGKNSKRSKA